MKIIAAAVAALVMLATPMPGAARLPVQPVGRSYAPVESWGAGESEPPAGPIGERASENDETDSEPGARQTHVIYFVPSDRPDQNLDEDGTLARSIDAIRDWFLRETRRDGRTGKRPRIDRLSTGAYDITFLRGQQAADAYTSIDVIRDELIARGFAVENKRYLVYAALSRGQICGEGYFPIPGVIEARYAVVYIATAADSACGGSDFATGSTAGTAGKAETIAVHEWLHNEGVVSPLSPHHCAAYSRYHVCTGPLWLVPGEELDPEGPDVMYPIINRRLRDKALDREFDDYLDHGWPHLANLRDSPWLE